LIRQLLDHPQALWAVAALLYALDVLRLLDPAMFLVEERAGRLLVPLLARTPFELGGRQLYWRGLLTPFRGVFAARLQGAVGDRVDDESVRALDSTLAALTPLRVLATVQFLLLFLAAPLITALQGLATAGLIVIPAAYAAGIGSIAILWWRRKAMGISARQALTLSAEWLLCVPYVANAVKRVVAARLDGQCGIASIASRSGAGPLRDFSDALAIRRSQAQDDAGDADLADDADNEAAVAAAGKSKAKGNR
jgi:hypothetical protein